MFKITGRIVLILLAASLVAGALYLMVNRAVGQPGLLSSLDRRGRLDGGIRVVPNGQVTPGALLAQGVSNLVFRSAFGDGGFRNRFSLGRGLSSVVSDLIVVTLITVLVVLVHSAIKKALCRSPVKTA